MTWVAVAAGAAAVIGGAASYAGSKKQSDAAKRGANLQMDQFNTLNRQQQPFIQSGYGAMSRLNTLLGLGGGGGAGAPGGSAGMPSAPMSPAYRPTPAGGMQQLVSQGPTAASSIGGNLRLKQLLALRASNGDTEAARILGQV